MKILIIAALVALAFPAHASEFRNSDRKWLPVMHEYSKLTGQCRYAWSSSGEPDGPTPPTPAVCVASEKLARKLEAHGYCLRARDFVGRASKDGKHCYEID